MSNFNIIDRASGKRVMEFEQFGKAWRIFIHDDKMSQYIFKKFPIAYEKVSKSEYDELQILDLIYTVKNKFRKFETSWGIGAYPFKETTSRRS